MNYLKALKKDHQERGWFVLDKNHEPDIVQDDELVGLIESLEELYMYEPPEDSVKILSVKAIVSFEKRKKVKQIMKPDDVEIRGEIEWSVYCQPKTQEEENQRHHIYSPISELWLTDILDNLKYSEWIGKIKKYFVEEQNTQMCNRYIDKDDEHFDEVSRRTVFGACDQKQCFYFDVSKKKYFICIIKYIIKFKGITCARKIHTYTRF